MNASRLASVLALSLLAACGGGGDAPKSADEPPAAPAENAGMAGLPGPSTYLVAADQAVDVPVTFAPGTYTFVCDPHTATGMKGKLTVTG